MRNIFANILAGLVVAMVGCGDSGQGTDDSNTPEVVACNSVRYMGYTFSGIGCEPGIASFDVSITQNGHAGSFHIVCSGGCVASAAVK